MAAIQSMPKLARLLKGEEGVGLVEVLIAITIVAIAATTYLSALSTTAIVIAKEDQRVTAKSLALSQLHLTRSQDFVVAPHDYDTLSDLPTGYTVSSSATAIDGHDDNIQKITITVQYNGKDIRVLEDYKVNR